MLRINNPFVPAEAGTQALLTGKEELDSRFRGNDRTGKSAAQPSASGRTAFENTTRWIAVIGLSLALGYLLILATATLSGQWLIDARGRPIASDFVNVWAAGRLAADGHPALAYDWTVHKSMEVRAVGYAFANYYGWHYPPTFLFVASALAMVPILPATFLWLAVTLPVYLAVIRAIFSHRAGYLLALGFPATLWNVTASQNGFLTAALIGGTLTLLERQPIAAGVCLGLLSYKPHFGLLFPIALFAARQWRALIAASATTLALIVLSLLVYGSESWLAFFAATPKMTEAVLSQGLAEFGRLQSVFGLVRTYGGSETFAWVTQLIAALGCVAATFALWRSRAAYQLKAGTLAALALIATPYLYVYDLCVLAVAFAFLLRYALARGMMAIEAVGLAAAAALLLAYPYVKTQVGLAAAAIILGLLAHRLASGARQGNYAAARHR
jgi:arabinofuranan 3-O-arabinosyltransferase